MRQVTAVRCVLLPALLVGASGSLAERIDVPAEFVDIQDAVDAAGPGDEVVVGPGAYSGSITINKPVVVRSSAGPEETILIGNSDGPVVRIESDTGPGGTLSGFTVTGGNGHNGGGLFLSGDVAVIDCTVSGNTAQNGGGAFLMGAPLLSGVMFDANTAHTGGAVFLGPDADALLDNCGFTGNSAHLGGAVFVGPGRTSGTFALVGAGAFEANTAEQGGGVMAAMSGFEIDQSSFRGNVAWDEGGAVRLVESTPSTATGTHFTLNESDGRGGAFRLTGSSDLLVGGCEIDQNHADDAGGGFDVEPGSTLSVAASSLWGNAPADIEGEWADLGENSFEQPQSCGADLAAPFGVLDMADIVSFVSLFSAEDPAADLAAPEGLFDLGDVIEFLNLYFSGCVE